MKQRFEELTDAAERCAILDAWPDPHGRGGALWACIYINATTQGQFPV